MKNVKLLNGIFNDSQQIGKEYLLYLDVDRLVASCYDAASQKPKKPRYEDGKQWGLVDIHLVIGFLLLQQCMW